MGFLLPWLRAWGLRVRAGAQGIVVAPAPARHLALGHPLLHVLRGARSGDVSGHGARSCHLTLLPQGIPPATMPMAKPTMPGTLPPGGGGLQPLAPVQEPHAGFSAPHPWVRAAGADVPSLLPAALHT